MKTIEAKDLDKILLKACPELDTNGTMDRMIITDNIFLWPSLKEIEEICNRNAVKRINRENFSCEEYCLTMLANIRNDIAFENEKYNPSIGMSGGWRYGGLSGKRIHMMILACSNDEGILFVEPQADPVLIIKADLNKFSPFNIWM